MWFYVWQCMTITLKVQEENTLREYRHHVPTKVLSFAQHVHLCLPSHALFHNASLPLSSPRPRDTESKSLSFRNINHSPWKHTHTQCWSWASLCIGSRHCILFGLSDNYCWHTVICAHIVYSLSVGFSLIIWNMTDNHFPLTEILITIQVTPLLGFFA